MRVEPSTLNDSVESTLNIYVYTCFWLAKLTLIMAWLILNGGHTEAASSPLPLPTELPKAQMSAVHEFCHTGVISSVIYLIALTYIFLLFVPEQNLISFWGSWKKQDFCDQYVAQPSSHERGHTQYYQKGTLVPVPAPDAWSCFLLWAHLTQNKTDPQHKGFRSWS